MRFVVECFCAAYRRGNFASIRGCACREEFWYFVAGHMLLQSLLYLALMVFGLLATDEMLQALWDLFMQDFSFGAICLAGAGLGYILFMLISIIPAIALTVRRYHDAGVSGRLFLAFVMGTIGFAWYALSWLSDTAQAVEQTVPPQGLIWLFVAWQVINLSNFVILIAPTGAFGNRYLVQYGGFTDIQR